MKKDVVFETVGKRKFPSLPNFVTRQFEKKQPVVSTTPTNDFSLAFFHFKRGMAGLFQDKPKTTSKTPKKK